MKKIRRSFWVILGIIFMVLAGIFPRFDSEFVILALFSFAGALGLLNFWGGNKKT
ncbi:MAG: hypothetical protein QQM50_00015 [Dehalococcoides mccartyi]|uniref:hypothetical protein n=1 Tax=Dehalococcoides TaxID=61434 RepID=UPI00142EF4C6|nr:hypothetical protein [Dehalococcoides mccartyi]MDP4278927.1 hypothetical protein [Dehalococcoides mccartyi]